MKELWPILAIGSAAGACFIVAYVLCVRQRAAAAAVAAQDQTALFNEPGALFKRKRIIEPGK
jgi:hypothetical protein